jgi:predicted RNA-binding Zn-ribbon protein involved in translation (DUF1610 family)
MNSLFEEKILFHMYGCKNCGYAGMLHRHGCYTRNVITIYQHFPFKVQRFICPSCRKTYSRLPACLIPYFVYSFDVIIFCLFATFSLSLKLNTSSHFLHSLNPQSFISKQSVFFLKKRFLTSLSLTNSFFALFSSFNYDMDLSIFKLDYAAGIVIRKILKFDTCSSFNLDFFNNMPKYFFSP